MTADLSRLVKELSRTEIETLLAAKDELESLETRRQELLRELATVEKRLDKLAGEVTRTTTGKKAAKARKKPGPKPRTAGTVAKAATRKTGKKAAKKTVKKAVRKAAKKTAKKAATRRAVAKSKPTVEDVVIKLIKKNRGPMPFKAILAAILDGKLVETRSKSFDNVLRRTLSTSEKIVNVSRGVYGLA